MVRLPSWTRDDKENLEPGQESAETTANKILQTSPQRRAFSHILRMLNSAHEAKGKCEEEKQRLVPKLLRLLKQARKEKDKLINSHELNIQKARREMASLTKIWEKRFDELKKWHASSIQEYQEKLDEKEVECQHLRMQSQKLVEELVVQEKRSRTIQLEKVNETVEMRNIVAKHETKILKLLEHQSEDRNSMLRTEIGRNEQLKVMHEEEIKTMEDKIAQTMSMVIKQLSHATMILVDLQQQKDPCNHNEHIHRLHQELAGIVNTIRVNRDVSMNTSTPSETFADCIMDLEKVQQLASLPSKSSFQLNVAGKQGLLPPEQRAVISQLQDSLGITQQTIVKLHETVSQLETKLANTIAEASEAQSNHESAMQKATHHLEASRKEQSAEKRANEQLKEIVDTLRRECEESKATIIDENERHDRTVEYLYQELATARNQSGQLTEEYESKVAMLEKGICEFEVRVSDLNNQMMECSEKLKGAQDEHESNVHILQEQVSELTSDITQEKKVTLELRAEIIEIARKHDEAFAEVEREHLKVLDEQTKELIHIQELFRRVEQDKMILAEDLSTQIIAIEAATEAEVFVLKEYVKHLELSIEELNASLNRENTYEMEQNKAIQRLKVSPSRHAALQTQPNVCASTSDDTEEGKENIICSSDYMVTARGGKEETSSLEPPEGEGEIHAHLSALGLHHMNEKSTSGSPESAENNSPGAVMIELKRTLFANSSDDEGSDRVLERRVVGQIQLDDRLEQMDVVRFDDDRGEKSIQFDLDDSFDMEDWRERCYFLERDREELVRLTDRMIEYEKGTHQLQLEAAVATAKREAMEQNGLLEQATRLQIRNLYSALCNTCRHKIDSA